MGNDGAIVGEAPFCEAALQAVAFALETGAARAEANAHVALFLCQYRLYQPCGLLGEDKAAGGLFVHAEGFAQREHVAVGGHHVERTFSEVEVDAVHDFADIVFGCGDNGTAHAVEQPLRVDVEFRSLAFFSGGRGILIGALSHNSILSVLINERDFERLVVDVKFQRLVGQFLDGVLNVAGVHGEANVGVAVGHVDGGRQHRFVVAGRDHEARALYVKHETVEDGHRVFLHNHAADGLQACRKQGTGNCEFHNGS